MNTIRTRSGLIFDYKNPKKEMVNIKDIAYGISLEKRYTNQTNPYSVAQHSIFICNMTLYFNPDAKQMARAGLFHDSAETYLRDLPSPLKHMDELRGYREIEIMVQDIIYEAMGIDSKLVNWDLLHKYDLEARYYERYFLLGIIPKDFTPQKAIVEDLKNIMQWNEQRTELEFLAKNLSLL